MASLLKANFEILKFEHPTPLLFLVAVFKDFVEGRRDIQPKL